MKTLLNSKLNQGLLFLSIAMVCTLFVSCNKKDSCQECAEEKAEQEALMNATSDTISETSTAEYQTEAITKNSSVTGRATGSGRTKNTATKNVEEEDDSNVSIIDPNDKSNSDKQKNLRK